MNNVKLKKVLIPVLIIVASFVLVTSTLAATFLSGEKVSSKPLEKVEGNSYVCGGKVNLENEVTGDLFTAGGELNIAGLVNNDLFAAGGQVRIDSKVNGDMRIAGGSINLNNVVNGEVLGAGGEISFSSNSIIEKDVNLVAGDISFDGIIKGKIDARAETIEINGKVDGDINIKAEELKIGKDANIAGILVYESPKQAIITEGAIIKNPVQFKKIEKPFKKTKNPATHILSWFIWTASYLALALVFFFMFQKKTKEIIGYIENSFKNFWKELLTGFVILIVLPIVMIAVAITVIGIPFSLIALLSYILVLILAHALAGIMFGAWLWKIFTKSKEYQLNWKIIVLGIVTLNLISLVPYIGCIIGWILYIFACGILWHFGYRRITKARN